MPGVKRCTFCSSGVSSGSLAAVFCCSGLSSISVAANEWCRRWRRVMKLAGGAKLVVGAGVGEVGAEIGGVM